MVGSGWQNNGSDIPVGVLNQSGGTITSQGPFLCPENGNGGASGTYNLSGTGVLSINNNFVIGPDNGLGSLNQSGGSISVTGETWIGQNGGTGTWNFNGGSYAAGSWFVIGRNGGTGVLNLTNGSITKVSGGSDFLIGGSGVGTLNQYGGSITNLVSLTRIGDGGGHGIWNFNGGTAQMAVVDIIVGGSQGTLNLNGGVMNLQELTTGNTAAISVLTFNGGILQASGANATFLHDIDTVNVSSGGAIFDSQNYNLTVSQAMPSDGGDNSGGLTKIGSGTLTLTGANSYLGDTVVGQGNLATTTATTGGGNYIVANGATGLGVQVVSASGQLNTANLNFPSTATALNFDLGGFGNPGSAFAPLNVAGTLAVNGTVTVNIADALPQLGQFPLIKYASLTGSGTVFILGSLPTGVSANLVNNTANHSIDLNITTVNVPRWEGLAGGNWDIGVTTNWINVGTGLPTFYGDNTPALFNDSANGTTTVNLVTTVHPASVTINNTNLNYTYIGSGSIAGSIGLSKQGTGSLSILNNNSYTGPTVISGGTLTVTNLANGGASSPIGASSANPTNLVINSGATFQYAGAPVSVNRGYQANSGTIDAEGNFTLTGLGQTASGTLIKIGPGKMTYAGVGANVLSPANVGGAYQVDNGTVVFDGSAGAQNNSDVGEMWVGGTPSFGANLILTNTTLTVGSWLGEGRGNGTINNTSTVTLYNSTASFGNVSLGYDNNIPGNLAQQFLTLNGNSTLTDLGDMNLGESGGSTATISINGTSVLSSQNRVFMALNANSQATLTIANNGQMNVLSGWFSLAAGDNCIASALLKDNGVINNAGDFNLTDGGNNSTASATVQDNATLNANAIFIGKNGNETGTLTVSGGTVIARGGDTQVGASGNGTVNQTGGTVIGTNWISIGRNGGGVGIYNLSGGSLVKVASDSRLNVGEGGTGTLNVSGTGTVVAGAAIMDVGRAAGPSGTVNLNGGSITVNQVAHSGPATATFNFNGGTLIAGAGANPVFMSGLSAANVLTNGAIIDSGANTITISQPLLGGSNDGGLKKLGCGSFYLNGVNTYTITTLVSAGALGGTGTIAGPLNVAAGTTLAPGTAAIGTFTVNSLVLSNSSITLVKISLDGGVTNNDQITGLTSVNYAGSLVVTNVGATSLAGGGTFQLFNASGHSGNYSSVTILPSGSGTFNPATGILTITPNLAPIVNPPTVSGGNLILTGNGGSPGTGYTWLTTTNLTNPMTAWVTNTTGTFSGTGTFSNSIPIIRTNLAQFFRLRTP